MEKQPMKILVVEDEVLVRQMLERLLPRYGAQHGLSFELVFTTDGMEGLQAAGATTFDVILTDIRMPRLTGMDLTRMVRADPAVYGKPRIIVMSAFGHLRDFQPQAMEAGADHVLTKPLDYGILMGWLSQPVGV
jgi:CheY-like chemotaxis protein